MKKVLIFYASYGGGHLSAAKSIEETLTINYPEMETKLIDCMKYVNKTIEKITTTAYKEMAKKFPWAWGKVYSDSQKGPLAHISSYSNKVMAVKLLKLLREEKPDMVISTHPFGSQMCSYLKRKGKINCKIATIMTDFAPHDQWLVGQDYIDAIFVSHEQMKQEIMQKGVAPEKIFSTGIPISKRFSEKKDTPKIKQTYNLQEGKQTVLFFGGGEFGLGKTKTLMIFEILVKQFPFLQIIAISGKNPKMKAAFEEIVQQNHSENHVCLLEFSKEIPELMAVSDFVVTKPGGLTVSESLASGLPLILINPIPGQEEENALFLEKKHVGIWIKKNDAIVEKFISFFQNTEQLNQMKKEVSSLAKPNAAKEICQIAVGLIKK